MFEVGSTQDIVENKAIRKSSVSNMRDSSCLTFWEVDFGSFSSD